MILDIKRIESKWNNYINNLNVNKYIHIYIYVFSKWNIY